MDTIKETKLSEVTGKKYTFPSKSPKRKLDYVFISNELNVKSAEVLEVKFSDHLPLIFELSIPD